METVEQAYRCLLLHHVGRNTVDHRALLSGALAGLEGAGKGKLTADDLAPLEFANDREADWGVFAARFNTIAAKPGRALDANALARAAIDAMAASLNDNHVTYLEPKLWISTFYAIAGFDVYPSAGFDVAIDPASGKYYLYEVYPNSPAARVGLKRGDIVERVGGGPASSGVNNQALYNLLVGLPGTGDVVEVTRPATGQTFSVIIQVADVEVPVIEARLLPGGIGYVRLRHFAFSVDEDFDQALAALRRQGLRGLIFDVRQNGGGSITAMAEIASHFTHDGPLAILVDENGASHELLPDTDVPLLAVPWVVLADGASASASDMTSAVARDRGGHLVGQRSAGALGAALFYELEDGSALEITVARVLGPDGEEINGVGVEPHHAITLTPLDLSSDWDPQLQHAIDELGGR